MLACSVKERCVSDLTNLSFRLIPQPDRRQRPDRRTVARGGRRASDRAATDATLDGASEDDDWNSGVPRSGPAKAFAR
jgi:hypothetical protein